MIDAIAPLVFFLFTLQGTSLPTHLYTYLLNHMVTKPFSSSLFYIYDLLHETEQGRNVTPNCVWDKIIVVSMKTTGQGVNCMSKNAGRRS
jgi:hypothetical protein